jgi:hypothetical protein
MEFVNRKKCEENEEVIIQVNAKNEKTNQNREDKKTKRSRNM